MLPNIFFFKTVQPFFFDKQRLLNLRTPLSIDEYIDLITKQIDTLSFLDLLEEGPEKQSRVRQNSLEHENTLIDLFYAVLVSPKANSDHIESFRNFMDDNIIPVHDKCMVISAITMNILHRFDSTKIEFMLDLCRRPEPELAARAITGLIPVFQIYNSRMELYSELGNRLKLLSDDKMFNRRFIAAIIGFIQAHETEKITKNLRRRLFRK